MISAVEFLFPNLNVVGAFLVFARLAGLFLIVPFFSFRLIPMLVKIGLAIGLTLMLLPAVVLPQVASLAEFVWILLRETFIGFGLGFMAAMVFAAAQMAGQLLDVEVGFGVVNVIDPVSGSSLPVLGDLFNIATLLVFLSMDGHHFIIRALWQSYSWWKVGGDVAVNAEALLAEFGRMFLVAVELALPVWAALFLTTVVLGLISRAVPQINVFILGMPLKLLVGLFLLVIGLPAFTEAWGKVLQNALPHILAVFKAS